MNLLAIVLAVLSGYLLGSLSFARIFLRLFAPEKKVTDVEVPLVGTDEKAKMEVYGANTVAMILGPIYGIMITICDMLKVALPMLAFRFVLYQDQPYFLIVSVFGLMGHNWPVYHKFKGGRGFSVILASFIVVDWIGAVLTNILGLLLGLIVFMSPMVAFVGWLWLMIPWLWFRTYDPVFLAYAIIMYVIFQIGTIPETKAISRYKREGKLEAYQEGMYQSSSMWKGMKRMYDRIEAFGKWRYLFSGLTILLIILTFLVIPFLPI